ncbi:protein-tyrosine-phosphatase [Escherichia coli]|uniref:Protein-tyrosine-phosphatase n=1 Tax=Escherichia coli TaxID=562 RepID=A0A377BBS9_ECOLX|nr:protein-tyrosine-phosphatase [Escherichia coli]
MFNNILVVCVGNICRSPTAERLLQRYHPELKVESAGLGALVGKGADPTLSASPQNINCLWKVTVHGKSAAACVATMT